MYIKIGFRKIKFQSPFIFDPFADRNQQVRIVLFLTCLLLVIITMFQIIAMSSSAADAFENEDVEEEDDLNSDNYNEEEEQVEEIEVEKEDDAIGEEDEQQQLPNAKTLMSELLDQYEELKQNSSKLPRRKAERLTSRAIGIS